jgi:putative membrane protein
MKVVSRTHVLLVAGLLGPFALGSFACSSDDDDNSSGTSTTRAGGSTGTSSGGGSFGAGGSSGGTSSGGGVTGGAGTSGTGGTAGGLGAGGSFAGGGSSGGTGGSSGSSGGVGGSSGSSGGASGDAGASDAGALSDDQVGGVAFELNSGEAMIGMLASSRAMRAEVKSFASTMVNDHSAAVAKLTALFKATGITPAQSPDRAMVAAEAMATIAMLTPLNGAAFDSAYMASQVKMHTDALMMLDTKLLPAATNAQLKSELTSMRATVAAHLMMAKQIQGGGSDGGAGDSGT